MQKIINRVLLLIVIVLVGLLAYRATKTPNPSSVPMITNIEQATEDENRLESKVEAIIKNYLMHNPEIIVSSLEQLQKKKMQELEHKVSDYLKENKLEIENATSAPILGNKEGKTIIVSFYDYNCSYCKKGNHNLNELIETNKEVKIILKPFPILGEVSDRAARIALAVNKLHPDKFINIHESLFNMKPISKEMIDEILKNNNINIQEIHDFAGSNEVKEMIDKNIKLASNLRVRGAPAYIINDKLIPGLIDINEFKRLLSSNIKQEAE